MGTDSAGCLSPGLCHAMRLRPAARLFARKRHWYRSVLWHRTRSQRLDPPVAARRSHGPVTPAKPAGVAPKPGPVGAMVGGGAVSSGLGGSGRGGAAKSNALACGGPGFVIGLGAGPVGRGQCSHGVAYGVGAVVGLVCAAVSVALYLGAAASGLGFGGFAAVWLGGLAAAGDAAAVDRFPGRESVGPFWRGAGLYQPQCVVGQCVASDFAKTLDGLGLG